MLAAIVRFLKESRGYVSGEEISRDLKMSRAAVWKHMQELRKMGYDIAAVPHLGYRLESIPDRLLTHEIQHELLTESFGKELLCLDSVDSTMNAAFALALDGAVEGTVVCAESQTKGRGRLGRGWSSPKGKGVYFSIVLRPSLSPMETAKLTLLAAVSVSEAIEEVTGVRARIKWPNDLLVNGCKLAGILTEMRAELDQVRFVVIGVGINVNNTISQLVDGATSLRQETQQSISRIALLRSVLARLELRYFEMRRAGFGPAIAEWKERSVTLNNRVRVQDPNGFTEGLAVDISDEGGLLIRLDDGSIIKRMAGDVTMVRPVQTGAS